jgi:hypothetical protein
MKFLERKLNTHKNYKKKHIKENKEYRFTHMKKKLFNSKGLTKTELPPTPLVGAITKTRSGRSLF